MMQKAVVKGISEKKLYIFRGKNEKSKTGAPVTPLCHCVGMPSVLHVRRGLK